MAFVDLVEIQVRAGNGGRGLASFRSARNKPRLGPDGGDGGCGGSVYFLGNPQLTTLGHLRDQRHIFAEAGDKGGGNGRTGRSGKDVEIPVPLGTVVTDADSGEIVAEILEAERYLIARGGNRGLGNLNFVGPRHQAPEEYTPGGPGEERRVSLELRLMADVGLVGVPNSGKSTLLGAVTAARPKIGAYPFTTIRPELGVVQLETATDHFGESFVLCDIPGLIDGASEGRGLGTQFLRHAERARALAFVVDGFGQDDPVAQLRLLRQEVAAYGRGLLERQAMVILSKADLAPSDEEVRRVRDLVAPWTEGLQLCVVSSHTGAGLDAMKRAMFQHVTASS